MIYFNFLYSVCYKITDLCLAWHRYKNKEIHKYSVDMKISGSGINGNVGYIPVIFFLTIIFCAHGYSVKTMCIFFLIIWEKRQKEKWRTTKKGKTWVWAEVRINQMICFQLNACRQFAKLTRDIPTFATLQQNVPSNCLQQF